jgi:hypothetical protein
MKLFIVQISLSVCYIFLVCSQTSLISEILVAYSTLKIERVISPKHRTKFQRHILENCHDSVCVLRLRGGDRFRLLSHTTYKAFQDKNRHLRVYYHGNMVSVTEGSHVFNTES